MLELEAKRLGYNLPSLLVPEWLNVVMQRYSISSLDDLYASVGYGGYSVHQILPKLIDFYRKEKKAKEQILGKGGNGKRHAAAAILIDGEPDLLCRIARCCNPVPGDEIVGYVSNGRGVTVHRTGCPNLAGVDAKKLIKASWGDKTDSSFVVSLQIVARNSDNLIVDVSTVISGLKLSIHSINGRVDRSDTATLTIGVNVNSIKEIDLLIGKLQQLPAVSKVFRSNTI